MAWSGILLRDSDILRGETKLGDLVSLYNIVQEDWLEAAPTFTFVQDEAVCGVEMVVVFAVFAIEEPSDVWIFDCWQDET